MISLKLSSIKDVFTLVDPKPMREEFVEEAPSFESKFTRKNKYETRYDIAEVKPS